MRCEICKDADADGVLLWRKSSGKHDMASCRPCGCMAFSDDRDYLYFGSLEHVKAYKQRGDDGWADSCPGGKMMATDDLWAKYTMRWSMVFAVALLAVFGIILWIGRT